MSLGYGWRAKIGQLYPSGGQSEYEPQLMAPEGVAFLTTRLPFKKAGLEDDIKLVADIEQHAQLLADAKVDLILLNCTAASLITGPDAINGRVEKATGIRSVTTIEAVMAALHAIGGRRLALMTPYLEEVVEAEIEFLVRNGFLVVASGGIPCTNPIDQGAIAPSRWIEVARELAQSDADVLLISCAGIQIGAVLGEIERIFDRPVVASNQAVVWHCLRQLGIEDRPQGFGDLLAGRFDPGAGSLPVSTRSSEELRFATSV